MLHGLRVEVPVLVLSQQAGAFNTRATRGEQSLDSTSTAPSESAAPRHARPFFKNQSRKETVTTYPPRLRLHKLRWRRNVDGRVGRPPKPSRVFSRGKWGTRPDRCEV